MDEDSTSAKRRRILENKMQLIERVREFQLPVQLPSTKQQAANTIVNKKNERRIDVENSPTSRASFVISKIAEMSSMKYRIPCKLRKLRILSPDGRDLGEFNLELREDRLLKRNKIVISKSRNFEPVERQVTISLSPQTSSRIFSQMCKRSSIKVPKYILKSDNFCDNNLETNEIKMLQQPEQRQQMREQRILPTHRSLMHTQDRQAGKQVCNINETSVSATAAMPNTVKYKTANSQNVMYNVMNSRNVLKLEEITTENNKRILGRKISGNYDSLSPIVNLQNFDKYNNNWVKTSTPCSKRKCIVTIKDTKYGKIVTSLTAVNFAKDTNETNKHCSANRLARIGNDLNHQRISNDRNNMIQSKSDSVSTNVSTSNQVHEVKLQKNIMTVIPNIKTGLLNPYIASMQEANIMNASSASDKDAANVNHSKNTCNATCDNLQNEYISKKTHEDYGSCLKNCVNHATAEQCTAERAFLQKAIDIATNSQLALQSNKEQSNIQGNKGKCIAAVKHAAHDEAITSLTAVQHLAQSCNKTDQNYSADRSDTDAKRNLDCPGMSNNRNTVLQDKRDSLSRNSQAHETNLQNARIAVVSDNKTHPKGLSQKDIVDRYGIIKKAIDSVQDRQLRELALQSLADCGIGIEKYVPIESPPRHKTVHDTQVQTTVFSLLDPKYFLSINEDVETLQRINHITLHEIPNSLLKLSNAVHPPDDLAPKNPEAIEQENPFDLDLFLHKFCEENSILKMKDTLSASSTRCMRIMEQLERDFQRVKQQDQNGRLSIHNAVLSDNIYLVQRQLMILKLCKENVDVMTHDGQTSLELAIKYDVRSEIVNLLLEAGAQPVLPRHTHESALIIASKQSSPLLSLLVRRVSNPNLLDQIDSEGFTALHYCSMHGNLQGVQALLSAGVTVDLKDMKSGRTALFHATDNAHTSVAQVLLQAGATAHVPNFSGQTPMLLTEMKSYKTVFKET